MADAKPIDITKEEAQTVIWAFRYVAQEQGQIHLKRIYEDRNLAETNYGRRAELLLNLADRIETEFNLDIFGLEKDS